LKVEIGLQIRPIVIALEVFFGSVYGEALHASYGKLTFLANEVGNPEKGVKVTKLSQCALDQLKWNIH
jgi:hypothetical protein